MALIWVNLLLPHNEPLATDVGGLYLGFAVVSGWAAWRPERTLVLAAAGLALLLIPPSLAIWAVRRGT